MGSPWAKVCAHFPDTLFGKAKDSSNEFIGRISPLPGSALRSGGRH
jgi:hypothetical protein